MDPGELNPKVKIAPKSDNSEVVSIKSPMQYPPEISSDMKKLTDAAERTNSILSDSKESNSKNLEKLSEQFSNMAKTQDSIANAIGSIESAATKKNTPSATPDNTKPFGELITSLQNSKASRQENLSKVLIANAFKIAIEETKVKFLSDRPGADSNEVKQHIKEAARSGKINTRVIELLKEDKQKANILSNTTSKLTEEQNKLFKQLLDEASNTNRNLEKLYDNFDKQVQLSEESRLESLSEVLTPSEVRKEKLEQENSKYLRIIAGNTEQSGSIFGAILKGLFAILLVGVGILIYKNLPTIIGFFSALKDKFLDFYKNFDWKNALERLKQLPSTIMDGLINLKDYLLGGLERLKQLPSTIMDGLINLKDDLLKRLDDVVLTIKEQIKKVTSTVEEQIKTIAPHIRKALEYLAPFINSPKEAIVNGLKELGSILWEAIKDGLKSLASYLWEMVQTVLIKIVEGILYIKGIVMSVNNIIGVFQAMYKFFKGTGTLTGVFAAIGSGYVPDLISKLFEFMGGGSGGLIGKVLSTIGGLFSSAASSSGPIGKILSPILTIAGRLSPFIARAVSIFGKVLPIIGWVMLAWDAIKGAIAGFTKDGISGAIKGLIAGVLSGLSFGLLSFDRIYGWIDGLVNWVAEGLVKIWDGISGVIDSVLGFFVAIGSWIYDKVKFVAVSIWDVYSSVFRFIMDIPMKIFDFVKKLAVSMIKGIIDLLPSWAIPDSINNFVADLSKETPAKSPSLSPTAQVEVPSSDLSRASLDSIRQANSNANMQPSTINNINNTSMMSSAKSPQPTIIAPQTPRNSEPTVRAMQFSEQPAF